MASGRAEQEDEGGRRAGLGSVFLALGLSLTQEFTEAGLPWPRPQVSPGLCCGPPLGFLQTAASVPPGPAVVKTPLPTPGRARSLFPFSLPLASEAFASLVSGWV